MKYFCDKSTRQESDTHWFAILFIAILSLTSGAAAQNGKHFYIDESTDFTGNGCQNADLNTVTSSIRSEMLSDGWTGTRYVNPDAWPQDFMESCSSSFGSGGLDDVYADTQDLAIYAGHGNKGLLQWGYQSNGRCTIDFSSNMRLGAMSGATAGFAIYITSCTLNTSSLVAEANFQWTWQQFGYHNSPSVGGDQAGDFYTSTGAYGQNTYAWLEEMEDKPGWFTGDNSPIVVSHGATSAEATFVRDNRSLIWDSSPMSPRPGGPSCGSGPPGFYYRSTLRNNGSGGC